MIARLWQNVQNLVHWLPIIWRDRDWDHAYLLEIMEFKFRRMAIYHETKGHTVNRMRTARQLRVGATLCKRLREDTYYDMATFAYGHAGGKQWSNHAAHLQRQDQAALGALIEKYICSWWD
jgi:hypothetical protein